MNFVLSNSLSVCISKTRVFLSLLLTILLFINFVRCSNQVLLPSSDERLAEFEHAGPVCPTVDMDRLVTASSLLGQFGSEVNRSAWHFLCSGWAALVATDAHDINDRRPRMKAAFRLITDTLSKDVARLLCIENPSRVVNNQHIVPVSLYGQHEVDR